LNPLLAAAGLPFGAPSAEPAASAAPEASAKEPSAESSAAPGASGAPGASASAAASTAPSSAPVAIGKSRPTAPRETTPAQPGEGHEPKEPETKPAATGGAAFDAGAAKTALTAAANSASSCKEAGGPTGSGKVSITFAASGRPTSVAVTGELAGTTVGSCVAKLFRAARVPAFSGDPVSVSKSFSVQ
jgi:hypothetical protein